MTTILSTLVANAVTANITVGRKFLQKYESSEEFGEDNMVWLSPGQGRNTCPIGLHSAMQLNHSVQYVLYASAHMN